MRHTDAEKDSLITRYLSGESVINISIDSGIARSTLYSWIKLSEDIALDTNKRITIQSYNALLQHTRKLEQMLSVLQTAPCAATAPLKEKLAAIEEMDDCFSVHVRCEALKVSRGTYYNHIFRNKRSNSIYSENRKTLRAAIQEIFEENRQIFGAGKINAILHERGYKTSSKTVAELMRELGIASVSPTAKKAYQKWKKGESKNIVHQDFHANSPNKTWVSDVTAYKHKDQYYYICVILDLYSRKVIAYRVSKRNSTSLITKTFRQAYAQRQPEAGLVFHSDRGTPYVSNTFQKLLCQAHATQSLSRSGRPHDNAVSESFFSYLKKEELYRRKYRSEAELLQGIQEYISFYNEVRPHGTLQYKTPDKMEEIAQNNR